MNHKLLLSLLAASTTVIFSSCSNTGGNNYPVAKPMVDPTTGIVIKGFKSGQIAGDPSTIEIDPETGKPNNTTMKIFKLP
jgi:hypothetical protein